ncbi:hypothetical protein AX16_003336 [Volvariella volvacea WC 439]|nr:hypothetical protein AX16_003336 [Volvariella volvacea WC 439]
MRALIFAGGIFSSTFALVSAQLAPCARTYTVQPGDWCDKISAEQDSSTFQLYVANIGVINPDCTNLVPGMEICLGRVGQDCTTVHVVQPGDTCSAISANAGISFNVLRYNNPMIDAECTNIYPGEVLCVADDEIEYTSETSTPTPTAISTTIIAARTVTGDMPTYPQPPE